MLLSHSRNGEKKSEDKDGGSFRYMERKHKQNERSETEIVGLHGITDWIIVW